MDKADLRDVNDLLLRDASPQEVARIAGVANKQFEYISGKWGGIRSA